jgi:hypothetical protein
VAHLSSIEQECKSCGARASVAVFNSQNGQVGVFCRRHGTKALERIKADEARWDAMRTAAKKLESQAGGQ